MSTRYRDRYRYPEPTIETGQVAKVLGISPQTVNRWANKGKLPCTKTPGGHRRFLVRDIEAFLGHPLPPDVKPIGTYCVDCGVRICGRKEVPRCHSCASIHWAQEASPDELEIRQAISRRAGLANFGKRYPNEPQRFPDGGIIHWDEIYQRTRPSGTRVCVVPITCACGNRRDVVAYTRFQSDSTLSTTCRTCSQRKASENRPKGQTHPWWRGGIHASRKRYAEICISRFTEAEQHILSPMAYNGSLLLHRAVVAIALGRPLATNEQVHHINGDKTDNGLSNLEILSPQEHGLLHGHR